MLFNIDAKIKFVRGNSFTRQFYLKNIDLQLVNSLKIKCGELNICENIYPDENGTFTFFMSSYQTSKFPDIHTTYSLDIVFADGSENTLFYKEQFIVLPDEEGSC